MPQNNNQPQHENFASLYQRTMIALGLASFTGIAGAVLTDPNHNPELNKCCQITAIGGLVAAGVFRLVTTREQVDHRMQQIAERNIRREVDLQLNNNANQEPVARRIGNNSPAPTCCQRLSAMFGVKQHRD